MSVEEFQIIVNKIRPFTNYIYLHVLGEPLLHPQLDKMLRIAETAGLNVNITTNGGLLDQKKELFSAYPIRQMNISLHDAEENIAPEKWNDYLQSTLNFAVSSSANTYICLRLWNSTNAESKDFNELCLAAITTKFGVAVESLTKETKGNGLKLADHIFLQRSPRFEWPDDKTVKTKPHNNCYALRDHIAILADGQVVPCCLDADANLKLGNIFTENLSDILETERSKNIKKGFEQRKIVESFCTTCGFSATL
jgi:radical SAM protein with 4Fe4S-binding SPASM domain